MKKVKGATLLDTASEKAPPQNQIANASTIHQPPRTITPMEDESPYSAEDSCITSDRSLSVENLGRAPGNEGGSTFDFREKPMKVGARYYNPKATVAGSVEVHQRAKSCAHHIEQLPYDANPETIPENTRGLGVTSAISSNEEVSVAAVVTAASEGETPKIVAEQEALPSDGPWTEALEAAAARYTNVAAFKSHNVVPVSKDWPIAQPSKLPEVSSRQTLSATTTTPEQLNPGLPSLDASVKHKAGAPSCVGQEETVAFEPWSLVEVLGHGALAAKLAAIVSNKEKRTEHSMRNELSSSNDSSIEKPASTKPAFISDEFLAQSSVNIARHYSPPIRAHRTTQLRTSRHRFPFNVSDD